jgi:hypothetical protein
MGWSIAEQGLPLDKTDAACRMVNEVSTFQKGVEATGVVGIASTNQRFRFPYDTELALVSSMARTLDAKAAGENGF